MTGGRIARKPVPSITEAFEEQQRLAVDKLLLAVEKEDLEKYKGLAESLLEETDSVTLLSAALKVLTKEPERTSVTLTGERTPGTKKKKR
jgi:ATP-dependent RNA helicase DeaD